MVGRLFIDGRIVGVSYAISQLRLRNPFPRQHDCSRRYCIGIN
jgi:hypothetical protein